MYKEIDGDLVALAKDGHFDIVAHGCNCFCKMGTGIALAMAKAFECNNFTYEHEQYKGDMHKLGCIDWEYVKKYKGPERDLIVVNAYTQYYYSRTRATFDYSAFKLCLKKINHQFTGKSIGLPQLGAGLGGGQWSLIKRHIELELIDMDVTVVIYNQKEEQ